jgi:septal ring factor EnvC (AmiA/AmiB activator)
MQKIKYIIILILALALVFLYIQLTDYDKISNSLLQQNSSSSKKIENLESQVSTLKAENQVLQDTIATQKQKIFLLEEELVLIKYDRGDTNTTNIDTNTTINDTNTTIENQEIQKEEKSIFDKIFNN